MKAIFFNKVKEEVSSHFKIASFDDSRPWGGFLVIDEIQAQAFATMYFDGLDVSSLKISGKLSPKILMVAPGQRLSWQYHHRRAEIWKVIEGEAGVITSPNDTEGELQVLSKGALITLAQGERHRLIGLEDWAVIAEIWQHTDASAPSAEEDIVRVLDDFGS